MSFLKVVSARQADHCSKATCAYAGCRVDPSAGRTVFMVEAAHARNIAAFSAFASEEELIILPGTQLSVKSIVPMGGGLHLVQMDEIGVPLSLKEFEED